MAILRYKDPRTGEYKNDIYVEGAVSSVNNMTGPVNLDAENIRYDESAEHTEGSVGAKLSQHESAIANKIDKAQGVANAGKLLGVGSNGNVDLVDKEVFIAEYGSTSYADITAAILASKHVQIKKVTGNEVIVYDYSYTSNINSSSLYFGQTYAQNFYYCLVRQDGTWISGIEYAEQRNNKVTSISSASTDAQYPSAKAVYIYAYRDWVGTQAEYDAIALKDSHTIYNIVEDTV